MTRRLFAGLVGAGVVAMHRVYRYQEHWWWDNLAHLGAGFAIGTELGARTDDRSSVLLGFLGLTTAWELFEFRIDERPWDGSMCWDHAMEDTVLDTVMGLAGAYLATRVSD